MSINAADDGSDLQKPPRNDATVLSYPFREMRLEWWGEFLGSYTTTKEQTTMTVRIMECLMAHALLHEDPYLEDAVVKMSRSMGDSWLQDLPADLSHTFEITHHIFKTICVTAKFPSADTATRMGLLKMTENRILEIGKAAKNPNMHMDSGVGEAVRVVTRFYEPLRENPDSRNAFVELMNAMKGLFFTVNRRSGVERPQESGKSWFETFVCCDGCPCSARLRTGPTIFLRDIEKAKVIDCIVMCAVKQGDALMHEVAFNFTRHSYRNFLCNPGEDDIGRYVQNGRLFYCRVVLFEAHTSLRCLRDDNRKDHDDVMDYLQLAVLWVKDEVKGIRDLDVWVPHLDKTFMIIEGARPYLGQQRCKQDFHTAEDIIASVFKALCAPEYHLAVHSREALSGKPSDMKCAYPSCPGTTPDLLKCSGCDVTYYCSADCQKKHWDKHKNFCHEIESRRAHPNPIPTVRTPVTTIKALI